MKHTRSKRALLFPIAWSIAAHACALCSAHSFGLSSAIKAMARTALPPTIEVTQIQLVKHDSALPMINGALMQNGGGLGPIGRVGKKLVPLAESPTGLSAPLRGAASPLRPSSVSRGFTPNPAPASRPPSAAVESQQLRHYLWRAALVDSRKGDTVSSDLGQSAKRTRTDSLPRRSSREPLDSNSGIPVIRSADGIRTGDRPIPTARLAAMTSDEISTHDERVMASGNETEQAGIAAATHGNATHGNATRGSAAASAPHPGVTDTVLRETSASAPSGTSQNVAWERIRSAIQRQVLYPRVGRRMRWQGRVVLGFGVGTNGYVHGVRVIKSSGHPALDDSALAAVSRAAPLPRAGAALEVELPIVFALRE